MDILDFNDTFFYERDNSMNKKKNRNFNIDCRTSSQEKSDKKFQVFLAVIPPLFVAFILFIAGWFLGILKLPDKVNSIEEDINDISKSISSTNDNLSSQSNRIDKLYEELALSNTKIIYPIDVATSALPSEIIEIEMEKYTAEPIWSSSGSVAKELKSGREYNAKELIGKKILIPYKENDQEVYFYGQYNENLKWDEECLINVYQDDRLIISSLGTFYNGNRIKYEQIFVEDSKWIYAKRVSDGNINSGDTWKYNKTVDYSQKISFENPNEDDMVRPDVLKSMLNESLVGRYHGSTSNGKYNDESGNAYFVSFNDDNTVKTLYHGNFKDGKFSDKTGNAWYITCNENTDYMYFMGKFENNTAVKSGKYYFENPIKRETLDRKVNLSYYNCPLNFNENKISNSVVD